MENYRYLSHEQTKITSNEHLSPLGMLSQIINFPFKWAMQSITYLGIQLPQQVNQGYNLKLPSPL